MNTGVCLCQKKNESLPSEIIWMLSHHQSTLKKQQLCIQIAPPEGVETAIQPGRSLWKRAVGSEPRCWIVVFVSLSEGGYCQPGRQTDRGCVWVGRLPICALFRRMAPCLHHTGELVFRGQVAGRVAGALIGGGRAGGWTFADVDFAQGVRRLLFHVVNRMIRVDRNCCGGENEFLSQYFHPKWCSLVLKRCCPLMNICLI